MTAVNRDWWDRATGNADDVADSIEHARACAQFVRDADGAGAPESVRLAAKRLDETLASAWDEMVQLRRACSRARRAELDSGGVR